MSVVFITCTKVCPIVRTTGFPVASKKRVGLVSDVFFHVPLIVTPLVAIQALPEPMTSASSRCFVEPSLSGPKWTTMTTTFLGATARLFAASIWRLSPVTARRYVFVARSYVYRMWLTFPYVTSIRPPESARLRDAPRALYQAVLPDQPDAGFIVVYEFADAAAATDAGNEEAGYLGTGPARVEAPLGTQYVLRALGPTLIVFQWLPAASSDPTASQIAAALATIGIGFAVPR